MKRLSILILSILSVVALASCDKEYGPVANTTSPEGPSINSPESGSSFELDRDQAEDTLTTIEWDEPDFGFTSAPTYAVELGMVGDNFSQPIELGTTQQTSFDVLVSELNQALLGAGLAGGESHALQLRVTASVSDSVTTALSEPVDMTVTPYQTDFPPIYMIGPAVSEWNPDEAVIVPSTEPNVYSTLAEFTNGEAFRFFGQQDWSPDSWNYPYFTGGVDELFVNANDGDQNFQFTGTTGWYRVTVNLDTKTVDLEAAEEPVMYMTGAGVGGWDTPGSGESVKMTFIQEGVWEATTEFNADGAFRFFAQADWSPTSYNYPYFADGTVDELLIDAEDDDNNFQFTGSTGDYYIRLNLNELTVEMEAQ